MDLTLLAPAAHYGNASEHDCSSIGGKKAGRSPDGNQSWPPKVIHNLGLVADTLPSLCEMNRFVCQKLGKYKVILIQLIDD